MRALVLALGWRSTLGSRLLLAAIVIAATAGFLLLGALLIYLAGVPAMLVHGAVWAAWLCWLGFVFPRGRARAGDAAAQPSYRRAFMGEILPGIACSFSLLARPLFQGAIDGGRLGHMSLILAGAPLIAAGGALIAIGTHTLGIPRTLFVHEYRSAPLGGLATTGIYSYIRHPLFVGGAAASVGLGLCMGTPLALQLAALNVCALPAYVFFEDRRCCLVIGSPYVEYRNAVGGVLPRLKRNRRARAVERPVPRLPSDVANP